MHPSRRACGMFTIASVHSGQCLALFAIISKIAALLAAPHKVHSRGGKHLLASFPCLQGTAIKCKM